MKIIRSSYSLYNSTSKNLPENKTIMIITLSCIQVYFAALFIIVILNYNFKTTDLTIRRKSVKQITT